VPAPLTTHARAVLWDTALAAVREHFRGAGLREVMTPPVVDAVAIEPWIEPLRAGAGFLHTSPELAMKQLLARGSGPIFQITHVARASEHGAWHREQFVLVEWYRDSDALADVIRDVERIVEAVAQRVVPWLRIGFLDAVAATLPGAVLRGDEDAEALARAVPSLAWPEPRTRSIEARTLEAWTSFFTAWSDAHLDPWLHAHARRGEGVHLVDFPAPLAALAVLARDDRDRSTSGRFESHALGRELANGYRELRDPSEQRARFARVAELREAHGLPRLPIPDAFLGELADLPACCGAALGLDRLVALAVGATGLDDVALSP
jgi:lysyl-tRNA synthetase class 2